MVVYGYLRWLWSVDAEDISQSAGDKERYIFVFVPEKPAVSKRGGQLPDFCKDLA